MTARRRVLAGATALAVAVVVLAGCGGLVGAFVGTQRALQNAGFTSVDVTAGSNLQDNVVGVKVHVDAQPSQTQAHEVASVVWDRFHEHFDELQVTVDGTGPAYHATYSFGQLIGLFGPRNPAYDSSTLRSSALRLGLIAIVVVAVVVLGIVALVVVVARRRRRDRPPPDASWPPGPGGPPGAGWTHPGPRGDHPGGWANEPPAGAARGS